MRSSISPYKVLFTFSDKLATCILAISVSAKNQAEKPNRERRERKKKKKKTKNKKKKKGNSLVTYKLNEVS